ncbi:MAG: MmgE/PrpD family protein [Desulforhabdus sp.]|jgi:2-methylcitrate dehydratase PrpD|nr:MmgE/PrpD family protein [Desulforhabdus sp.]
MDNTDRIIDFILGLQLEDVPTEAVHQGKRCFLDTLGALLGGASTPVAQLMAELAVSCFAGNDCTLLANGGRASPVGAALVNGFAVNALDIDDGHRLVKGHPGACVMPVLIAAAELAGSAADGRQLLTSLIIGYEVGIRAGLIRHATYSMYHASGSWGAVAGAAVAGRMIGLERTQLREALGTAEYHAPIAPMMKGIEKPSMGKDGIGWGAMAGMASALMAQRGFTGIESLFEDTPEPGLIESIGTDYLFMNLYFKPYAACRWAQPAAAGALKIFRSSAIDIESIVSIKVKTFKAAASLSNKHPHNTEEAQYNLAYPVAAALLDGEVGAAQVLPPRIFDKTLLALSDKVEVMVDEEFERAFPQKTHSEVIIRTRDGKALSSGSVEPPWEAPDTLPTDAELESKFHRLVEPILGATKSLRLIELAWSLDQISSIKEITELCRYT